jgi:hypothetical protein
MKRWNKGKKEKGKIAGFHDGVEQYGGLFV